MDDGADVIGVLHSERTDQLTEVIGGTEETTTGVIRLRALEAEGKLAFPIVAVNEANTKHMFDNRYGTGQSTLDGIIRATNILIAGKRVVVFGYGWCGKGVAMRAKGHGAHVIVCEVDPLKALEAVMDGFEVMPGSRPRVRETSSSPSPATCTCSDGRHFGVMKNGAIVANSGHFNVEIDIPALLEMSTSKREARPFVEQYDLGDGRHVFLLAEGRLINLAAAEGHPAAVMDMSFANQALAAEHIAKHHAELERKVYVVPEEIDKEIARLKLESMGIAIDTLTAEQEKYLSSWDQGTEPTPRSERAGEARGEAAIDEGDAAGGGARHPAAAADLRAAEADGADPRPAGDGAHPAAAGAAWLRRRDREPALLPRPDPEPVRRRVGATACGSCIRSSRS